MTAVFSFGSLFFVPNATQTPILVSALASRGKPSLISAGNCTPEIGAILEKTVEEHGRGLIKVVKWAAQQAVLRNPVRS